MVEESVDLIFKVNSIRSGWIELDFFSCGKHFPLKVSNRVDPIDEYLDILLKLNDYFREPPIKGEKDFCLYLFWEGMKTQYTLEFTPNHEKGSVSIKISYCDDTSAGIYIKDEMQMEFEVPYSELVKKSYDEILGVLLEYGFHRYRKEWVKSCFPVSLLLSLHNIVIDHRPMSPGFSEELATLNLILKSNFA